MDEAKFIAHVREILRSGPLAQYLLVRALRRKGWRLSAQFVYYEMDALLQTGGVKVTQIRAKDGWHLRTLYES